MLARELTQEHIGRNFRLEETSVVVRVDGFVIGNDSTLIRENYPSGIGSGYTWTVGSDTTLEEI